VGLTAAEELDQPDDWTEPGAYPVARGVFRIPLPLPSDGLRAVNVYALATDDGLVLIDGGWALDASRRQLIRALAQLDREPGDITRFLVTHVHRDHYTQAVAIRRELGTRVSMGVGERPSLELIHAPDRRALGTQLRRMRVAGADALAEALLRRRASRPLDLADWAPPDDWIADDAAVLVGDRRLRAMRTPGHTQGHLVFADTGGGVLFAGDHVLPHITPSIGFEPVDAQLPLGDYLQSLAAVRELPDLWLLPAHGPVTGSVHARVDALVAHHDERLDATWDAVRAGAVTAYDTARRLRWTRRGRGFDELDVFNRMLAVSETLAHLDLLAARGRLHRATDDGVVRYTPAPSDG
jgi:glyoxylase-like metal-dependent hydrolase (beta-lactamase superfamily II)